MKFLLFFILIKGLSFEELEENILYKSLNVENSYSFVNETQICYFKGIKNLLPVSPVQVLTPVFKKLEKNIIAVNSIIQKNKFYVNNINSLKTINIYLIVLRMHSP